MYNNKESVIKQPFTGDEYLNSLEDDREVWIYGKRVASVITHPAFNNTARMIARLYNSLHQGEKKSIITCPTDTGSGGVTHRFFRASKSAEELLSARDAIAEWARMTYGWMGRSPDYKAAFLSTLGANADFFGDYADNARYWYKKAQEQVLFLSHAIVDPPVDRNLSWGDAAADIRIRVEAETDAGIVVSGAKTVATNAALSQYIFVAQLAPVQKPEEALVFILPINASGVKILSRPSYQMMAQQTGSPFDYPLSSRLDENDAIIVCDKVLIPWENILVYRDKDKLNEFLVDSGFEQNVMFHGCIRLAVKMDFICGLLLKALEITGAIKHRGVKVNVGEALAWRNMFWSQTETMARVPSQWRNGTVLPNNDAGLAYIALAPTAYSKVKEIVENLTASGLIYVCSHADDFKSDSIRPYLDRYMRGTNGADSVERVKTMKLLWDAVGTEFAGRHELYEHNYIGNHEVVRLLNYMGAENAGQAEQLQTFVDACMNEYDLDGWKVDDLINNKNV